MNKIDSLLDIKYEALYLERQLLSGNTDQYQRIEKDFEDLTDRFYRENGEFVTERQYKTARDNVDYFIVLVDQVLSYYKEE